MLSDLERATPQYYLNHYLSEERSFVIFRKTWEATSALLEESEAASAADGHIKDDLPQASQWYLNRGPQIDPRVNRAYSVIRRATGPVSGYGIPDGETYGEFTVASVQVLKIVCTVFE